MIVVNDSIIVVCGGFRREYLCMIMDINIVQNAITNKRILRREKEGRVELSVVGNKKRQASITIKHSQRKNGDKQNSKMEAYEKSEIQLCFGKVLLFI